jgi:phage host-nuclease inhibitor protein Gam
MTTTPFPSPATAAVPASIPAFAPKIQTHQQIEALVENITRLQGERDALYHELEQEIAAIRERYRMTIAEVERYLDQETAWAESWARGNREAFGAEDLLDCASAKIGFRATEPRIERASRRWNWTRMQGERFFIAPHGSTESVWQEAA